MQARAVIGSILLVLSSALAACSDESAATQTGDIINARLDDQFSDGQKAAVTIPTGRLLIHAEEPVDRAAADETRAREVVQAPAGTVLVPITWQYDPWASDRLDGIVATNQTPIVDLVTGGESYRLRPPRQESTGGESFYVVVDGDAADRMLEIEFDGVTQTVDLTKGSTDEGEASALYEIDDDALKKKTCDDKDWFDSPTVSAEFSCDYVGPVLTPYAAGEWAPEGSLWLALTLRTEMRIYAETDLVGGGVRYSAGSVKVTPEIDRQSTAFELPTNDEDDICPLVAQATCGWSRHLVFEVPADDGEQGPLRLEVAYKLAALNTWGNWDPPQRTTVKATEKLKIWEDQKEKKDKKKNNDD